MNLTMVRKLSSSVVQVRLQHISMMIIRITFQGRPFVYFRYVIKCIINLQKIKHGQNLITFFLISFSCSLSFSFIVQTHSTFWHWNCNLMIRKAHSTTSLSVTSPGPPNLFFILTGESLKYNISYLSQYKKLLTAVLLKIFLLHFKI